MTNHHTARTLACLAVLLICGILPAEAAATSLWIDELPSSCHVGEPITIGGETRGFPDGTAIEILIFPVDDSQADTVYGECRIAGGKFAFTFDTGAMEPGRYALQAQDSAGGRYDIEELTLFPATGSLLLTSSPSGAAIIIDGERLGTSGSVIASIPAGWHEVTVSREGCVNRTETVLIPPGEFVELHWGLAPAPTEGWISVCTHPDEADIYLDGISRGKSDMVLSGIPAGTHTITITLTETTGFKTVWYEDYTAEIEVLPGKGTSVSATLRPRPYSTWLVVRSYPENAEVYLDGTYQGTTQTVLPFIEEGHHILRLEKPGYEEIEVSLNVPVGGIEFTRTLTPIETDDSIRVLSEPDNTSIFLNGDYAGRTPLRIDDLAPGIYYILLLKDGYSSWHRTVTLAPESAVTVIADLVASPDAVHTPPSTPVPPTPAPAASSAEEDEEFDPETLAAMYGRDAPAPENEKDFIGGLFRQITDFFSSLGYSLPGSGE
ncbi:MAG: PEGA domain-containing protein [Methanomicrobiaceae archaeon]|nr:PEGA domain-containing protein [Methanomicrobiaceae archaeon]